MKSPLRAANGGAGIDLRFIGYTSTGDTSLMAEPQAPKNYKDAGKIAEYIAKARVEQAEGAAITPYCGSLTRIVVFDEEQEVPLVTFAGETTADDFVTWLDEQYPNQLGCSIKGDPSEVPAYFLGINIKTVMEMACKQVLRDNANREKQVKVPVRLWYNTGGLLHDVSDCAIAAADRSVLSLVSVMQALRINIPIAEMHGDPRLQALASREITQKLQLFGQWEE